MDTVIVTRHAGLVEWLKRRGIEGEVVAHAGEGTVKGKRVYGVLPYRLAALADEFVEVGMDVPAELRGKELTADDIDGLSPQMAEWVVGKKAEKGSGFPVEEIHSLKGLMESLRSFRKSMEIELKDTDPKTQPVAYNYTLGLAGGAAWAIDFVKALFALDGEDECAKCRQCKEHKPCRLLEAGKNGLSAEWRVFGKDDVVFSEADARAAQEQIGIALDACACFRGYLDKKSFKSKEELEGYARSILSGIDSALDSAMVILS